LSGLDPESGALSGCFTRARTSGMSTSSATEWSLSGALRLAERQSVCLR
jgi:hypothetical protein